MSVDKPGVTAGTVCRRAELPRARVLARSYLRHHPGHRFVLLVLDGPAGNLPDGAEVRTGDDITPDFRTLATGYRPHELTSAMKPLLLRHLLATAGTAIYLDPTMYVLAPLPELADADTAVFTPFTTSPLPADFPRFDEAVLVGGGRLAPGVAAVGRRSGPLLDAWCTAAARFELTEPGRMLFSEQRWFDAVAASYPHRLLSDESVHIACWNAFARTRSTPRLVNLPGFDPAQPALLSRLAEHRPRSLLSDYPALRAIAEEYAEALLAQGWRAEAEELPGPLDELPDGTVLSGLLRHTFRHTWQRHADLLERGLPWPEAPLPWHAWTGEFRDWLAAPADGRQAAAGMTRWAMALHHSRTDLQLSFPDPLGDDREAYREWCAEYGVRGGDLARWALPGDRPPVREPDTAFGVNLLGNLTAELGVGELARTLHATLRAAEVPAVSIVDDRFVNNRARAARPDDAGEPRYGVSVVVINAEWTEAVQQWYPQAVDGRYRIGVWSWELEEFPDDMHAAFDLVDEVWTISEFCAKAIAAHTDKPVRVFPIPVSPPRREIPRREPGAEVRFLFAFDYNSKASRKNPFGVVEAFHRAFRDDQGDVRLVLKAINPGQHVAQAERLRALVAGDPRITLIEDYLSAAELDELYSTSDCYVSLHRSEGFGFTIAEAIARGLPVIYTDYSGNAEFTKPAYGWPVPYTLTEVGPGSSPYPSDAQWAEPDLDAAAKAMREVAADPVAAAELGRAARADLLRERSLDAAAGWVADRLAAAHAEWLARVRTGNIEEPEEPAEDPIADVRLAREALRWRAEAETPSRLPGAPLLRRAVLRAMDHYDVHNRKVLAALMDGVESTVTKLAGRVAEVEAKLDRRERGR